MRDYTDILMIVPGFVAGLTFHEFSHAWMANRLGDNTARSLGRLSLNPLAHLDLMGSLMLIFVGFGWAKPVPVNGANLQHPRRDMALIALAGPASNLLMALTIAVFIQLGIGNLQAAVASSGAVGVIVLIAVQAVWINVILAVFNLIPLPPLDGSRILAGVVPESWNRGYDKLERYGPFILLGLFLLASLTGVSIFGRIVSPVAHPIVNLLLGLDL
jgi:Zn-dependent protease